MTEVKMRRQNGVYDAMKVEDREYLEVPGTEGILAEGALGVSRGGVFKEMDYENSYVTSEVFDAWPYAFFTTQEGIVRADVTAAVALAWLDEAQRADIRIRVPAGTRHDVKEIIDPIVAEYNVGKHAIAKIARTPEEELVTISMMPEQSKQEGVEAEIIGVTPDEYTSILFEHSRPPSRGGNTSALHLHRMKIDGEWYTFFSRGSKKLVFKNDTVSFRYILTPEGYRNVIKHTIVTHDAKGARQYRGDRRYKKTLRTAPMK